MACAQINTDEYQLVGAIVWSKGFSGTIGAGGSMMCPPEVQYGVVVGWAQTNSYGVYNYLACQSYVSRFSSSLTSYLTVDGLNPPWTMSPATPAGIDYPIVGVQCAGTWCNTPSIWQATSGYVSLIGQVTSVSTPEVKPSDEFECKDGSPCLVCPDGFLVNQLACSGSNCASHSLTCKQIDVTENLMTYEVVYMPWFSNGENPDLLRCPDRGFWRHQGRLLLLPIVRRLLPVGASVPREPVQRLAPDLSARRFVQGFGTQPVVACGRYMG